MIPIKVNTIPVSVDAVNPTSLTVHCRDHAEALQFLQSYALNEFDERLLQGLDALKLNTVVNLRSQYKRGWSICFDIRDQYALHDSEVYADFLTAYNTLNNSGRFNCSITNTTLKVVRSLLRSKKKEKRREAKPYSQRKSKKAVSKRDKARQEGHSQQNDHHYKRVRIDPKPSGKAVAKAQTTCSTSAADASTRLAVYPIPDKGAYSVLALASTTKTPRKTPIVPLQATNVSVNETAEQKHASITRLQANT